MNGKSSPTMSPHHVTLPFHHCPVVLCQKGKGIMFAVGFQGDYSSRSKIANSFCPQNILCGFVVKPWQHHSTSRSVILTVQRDFEVAHVWVVVLYCQEGIVKRKLLFVIFVVYLSKASNTMPWTTVICVINGEYGNVYPSDFTGTI